MRFISVSSPLRPETLRAALQWPSFEGDDGTSEITILSSSASATPAILGTFQGRVFGSTLGTISVILEFEGEFEVDTFSDRYLG